MLAFPRAMSDDPLAPIRRFARNPGDKLAEPDPFLCRHLRTRTWFSQDAFGQGESTPPPATAPYWCLRTMQPKGPDGELAQPEECTDERICFEATISRGRDA